MAVSFHTRQFCFFVLCIFYCYLLFVYWFWLVFNCSQMVMLSKFEWLGASESHPVWYFPFWIVLKFDFLICKTVASMRFVAKFRAKRWYREVEGLCFCPFHGHFCFNILGGPKNTICRSSMYHFQVFAAPAPGSGSGAGAAPQGGAAAEAGPDPGLGGWGGENP